MRVVETLRPGSEGKESLTWSLLGGSCADLIVAAVTWCGFEQYLNVLTGLPQAIYCSLGPSDTLRGTAGGKDVVDWEIVYVIALPPIVKKRS